MDNGEVIGSVLLTSFAGMASWALWFYGQRYVGELALLYVPLPVNSTDAPATPLACAAAAMPHKQPATSLHAGESGVYSMCLQLSTLDFWGKRHVRFFFVLRLITPPVVTILPTCTHAHH